MAQPVALMDNPLMVASDFPVVAFASEGTFAPGGRAAFRRVESRQVMLCRAGFGTADINGTTYRLAPGNVLVMPWACSVSYVADQAEPFSYSGAHLIPRHREGYPITVTVPHDSDHELAGCGWRRDDPALVFDVLTSTAIDAPDLAEMLTYAARRFEEGSPPELVRRALGALVAYELKALTGPPRPTRERDLPRDLRRIVAYVDSHLDAPITGLTLARVAACSESTLTRRFRAHLQVSPMAWVATRRMRRATDLLRTTELPISQVARLCGIPDPYYFSRLFRKQIGTSPTDWRRAHSLV